MPFTNKSIHEAIHSLQMEGRSISELEGLLMHEDDLLELLQSFPEYKTGMAPEGCRMYGVKLIGSRYAEKGTIFRIYKTDDKLYAPSQNMGGMMSNKLPFSPGSIPSSGMFTIPSDSMPDYYQDEVVPGSGKIHVPQPEPTPAVPKKPEKKRHSDKRKIDLD